MKRAFQRLNQVYFDLDIQIIFYKSKSNLPDVIFTFIKVNVCQSLLGAILSFSALFVFVMLMRGHLTVLAVSSIQFNGTTPSSSISPSFHTALAYMI